MKRSESRRLSNNVDATYLDEGAVGAGASGSSTTRVLRVVSSGEISASPLSVNRLVSAIRGLRT